MSTYFAEAKNENFMRSYDLQKKFNNEVAASKEYEWLDDLNTMFRGEAFKDFGLAITTWHKQFHKSMREPSTDSNKGKPHYKKKGKCQDSARMFKKNDDVFRVESNHFISFTRVRGQKRLRLKTAESLEFLKNADIKTCTFSREADHYFISLTYEKTNRPKTSREGKIGIDLGVRKSLTCFDGTVFMEFGLPMNLERAQKRTEKINKQFSKTQKGSKNHQKLKIRLERAYAHERNIKKDFREKLTTWLADNYSEIKIDDFTFENTLSLDSCNRKLYNISPYAFKLRLEQKVAERKHEVFYIPKFTPSTQTCSCCGATKKMKLSDTSYVCPNCGTVIGRDKNSAVFVYNY